MKANLIQKVYFKIKSFSLLMLLTIAFINLYSQTQWTKQGNNPVICFDTITPWWESIGQPSCIIENDTIKMWYAVAGDTSPSGLIQRGRIHYAWSIDGVHWNKSSQNPALNVGGDGTWDGQWLDTPEILRTPDGYKLYYYGDSTYQQGTTHTKIGVATSTNGINWVKHGPVLQKGNPDSWDGIFIESPAAYYDPNNGLHALLYTGIGVDTILKAHIGLAVSTDGLNFVKYPIPVFTTASPFCWDDKFVAAPALIKTEYIFEMWYSGISRNDLIYPDTIIDSVYVGYAVSINGINWLRYPGNPVLKPSFSGDPAKFWAIDVVFDQIQNEYKIYYESDFKSGTQAIYLATAPRNILFSSSCDVSVSNDISISQGDTTQLSATGGTLYYWSPEIGLNSPNIANPLAYPDSTIKYTVLIVGSNCITTDSVIVNINPITNVFESSSGDLNIYPNPVTQKLFIELSSKKNTTIEITNLEGVILKNIPVNNFTTSIDLTNLSVGIYLIKIKSDREIIVKKLLRQ